MNSITNSIDKPTLKLLEELGKNEGAHIRMLAKLTESSTSLVHRNLKKLVGLRLVIEKSSDNKKIFFLNRENVFLRKIISLINISELFFMKELKDLKKLGTVGVYGSFASGESDKLSDIDIWIYSKKNINELKARGLAIDIQKKIGRRASILILNDKKIERLRKNDAEFFYRLKLTSISEEDVFG